MKRLLTTKIKQDTKETEQSAMRKVKFEFRTIRTYNLRNKKTETEYAKNRDQKLYS